MEPMLSDATSGLSRSAGWSRSSTAMVGARPVVRLITTFAAALIFGRNCRKSSGSWEGLPFCGSRAWRWTTAAPASAAPIAPSAISSGVMGRYGDIEGVWIAPVTAQVMMTFRDSAISVLLCELAFVGRQRHQPPVAPAFAGRATVPRQQFAPLALDPGDERLVPGLVGHVPHHGVERRTVAAGVVAHPVRRVEVDGLER